MNKVHKSVWNASAGTYVAAAETTKARGKKSSVSKAALGASAMALLGSTGAHAELILNDNPIGHSFGMVDACYGYRDNPGANGFLITGSACEAPTSSMTASGLGNVGQEILMYSGTPGNASLNSVAIGGYLDVWGTASLMGGATMNNQKITNLADGTNASDAVNWNQLYQRTRYFNANSPSTDQSSDARATGASSVASGPFSMAIGNNSSAYGANAVALASGSVALGANSVASRTDSVSVGYLSGDGSQQYTRQITNVKAGAAGTDAVNVDQLNAAIESIGGNPSGGGDNVVTYDTSASNLITLKGSKGTKITNLVAGDISSLYSTDAVNGSQLFQTNQNVANVANNLANLSGNVANVTNTVNNIVNNGIAGSPLVVLYDSSARDSVTLGGVGNTTPVKLKNVAAGDISSAASTDAVNGGQLYQTNQNVAFIAQNVTNAINNFVTGGIKYFHANSTLDDSRAVGLNSVAIGSSADAEGGDSVALGSNSVANRGNAVSIGYAGGERQIINVAQGTANTDAVNVQQLNNAVAAVSGGGSPNAVIYDTSAHDKVTFGGTGTSVPVTLTNVAAGQITPSSKDAINGSQLFGTANSVAAALGGNITVGTDGKLSKPAYTLDGSTYGDVGAALAAVDAKAGTGSTDGVKYDTAAHTKVTFGGTAATTPVTLSNVADGVANRDAVNVEQLKAMGANIDSSGNVTGAFVAYDNAAKSNVTLGGAGATSAVGLTNVAAGQITSSSKDAINGSQLYGTAASVAAALGGNTVVNTNGTISAPAYALDGTTYHDVGSALDAMGSAIDGLDGQVASTSKYIKVVSTSSSAIATGSEAVAIGGGAYASGTNSLALGSGARSQFADSVAIGSNSTTTVANTISVGSKGAERRIMNVANGVAATDVATFGQLSALQTSLQQQLTQQTSGVKSMMMVGASTPVTSYIAVSSNVTGGTATNTDNSLDAMAIGPTATALGKGSLAVGAGAGTAKDGSTAVGNMAAALALNTTVIGAGASTNALADNAVAIGYNANSQGANGLALGSGSQTNMANSVAMGSNAFVMTGATNSMALGANASASQANSVALGAGSVADRANTISVGNSSTSTLRKIANMAAGTSSTDAVNVSQLAGLTAALGGQAAVSGTDGSITNPSYTIGGKTYHDVGSALVAVASSSSPDSVMYDTSSHTKVTLGGAGSTTPVTLANVADGKANNDAVNVEQLKAMGANIDSSGNISNAFVSYDNTTKNKVTLGGAGSTTPVTLANVADGKANNDAVNVEQLKAMGANIDSSGNISNAFVSYDNTTKNKVTLGGAGSTTPVTLANVADGKANNDAVNVEQLKAMGANIDSSGNISNAFVSYDNTTKNKVTLGGAGSTTPVTLANVADGKANNDAVNV
ncbi:autotransporter adhesin, partial [Paraburkholderia sp. GAS38]|uniref:ESPR-type extended signal peptide-containing protein n=1 Tax=Paraburkholderia sp. GAS38 TaxID=3035133 RepID=UPI003D225D98